MADMRILIQVVAQTNQAQAALTSLGTTTQVAAAKINSAAASTVASTNTLARASSMAGKALLIGVGAGLAISAKAAIDFESSFAGIRKTVDASEAQFAQLEGTMRGLAKVIPINVNELNKIGEIGGQMGIGVDALGEFTDTVAKLGVTTDLTVEDASFALGRLAAIMNLPKSAFSQMGSVIVDLGNKFEGTEPEITAFALRIAATGNVVGLSIDQVLGLATAFSSLGIPAERGGTAVNTALSKMYQAVLAGGDQLELFANTAGMTADEFATAFRDNAGQAFAEFLKGLNRAKESGLDVFSLLQDLGLGSIRTSQAVLTLAVAGDRVTETLDASATALADNNALNIEAEKRFGTTASKIQLAVNAITDLRIEIGQTLLPIIGDLASGLGNLIGWIEDWDSTTKTIVGRMLLFAAAFAAAGKSVKILSRVIHFDLVASLRAASIENARFVMGAKQGTLVMSTYSRRMTALSVTLGKIGIAGALIIATKLLGDFISKQIEAKRKVDDLVEAFKQEREGIMNVVHEQVKADIFGDLSTGMIAAFNKAGVNIDDFVDKFIDGDKTIGNDIKNILAHIDTLKVSTNELGQMEFHPGVGGNEIREFLLSLGQEATAAGLAIQKNNELVANSYVNLGTKLAPVFHELKAGLMDYAEAEFLTATKSSENFVPSLEDQQLALEETATALAEAEDEMNSFVDAQRSALDPAYALIAAVQGYADATAAVNAEGGYTTDNLLSQAQAYEKVKWAALDLGPNGFAPLLATLGEMQAAGIITANDYLMLAGVFSALGPAAASANSAVSAQLISMAQTAVASGRMTVSALEAIMWALGVSVAGYGNYMNTVRNVQQALASGHPLTPGEIDAAVGGSGFSDLGAQLAQILASGFSSVSAGGGGGGGGLADAVETEIEKAARLAREGISAVSSAISSATSLRNATTSLHDAEQALADLRQRRKDLPGLMAEKERELAEARRAAAEVTLDEQKAIEDSEEAYKRAVKAHRQGLITDTDLALAVQAIEEARTASTAAGDDEKDIQEELMALQQEELDMTAEIKAAKDDLRDAQLSLIDAQLGLIDASLTWESLTPAQIRAFRKLAIEAGLTRDEIDALIASFVTLSTTSMGTGTGPGATAQGPTIAGVANSGDILSYLHFQGVNLKQLGRLSENGTSRDALGVFLKNNGVDMEAFRDFLAPLGTTQRQVLDALSAGGYTNIPTAHGGGIVGGIPGREVLIRAMPGEVVSTAGSSRGIVIGNVTMEIQGVWDLTDRTQVTEVLDVFEQEIRVRAMGK